PVVYGLWMGSEASLYRELFADPIYQSTVVNTILYLALGVNVKMFLALLLSGFFMRPGWWMKALLLIFVLPWAVPQISTFISIHWMLNGEWGFLNNVIYALFHVDGPHWLNDRWSALSAVIVSHIWKWTPLWTLLLPDCRMAAPLETSAPARHPAGDRPYAQAPHRGGSDMSTIAADARLASRTSSRARSSERLRRYLRNLGTLVLSAVILVWTLVPLYNMVLISLEPEGDV